MEGYSNNTEWSLKILSAEKIVKKFECCPNDTFPIIVYTFSIERQPGLVHITSVTPAIGQSISIISREIFRL